MANPNGSAALAVTIAAQIRAAGGWIGFDRFMSLALYTPGLGYYAHGSRKFGTMPGGADGGSDFVTAPEMTPLFGQALAVQIAEALKATGTREVWEFGAGSGALAGQLLRALGDAVERYTVVDLSGALRARQQQGLAAFGDKVRWVDALPDTMQGVLVGNEVLDAMPVKLLVRQAGTWHERGVVVDRATSSPDQAPGFAWSDRPTTLRPPGGVAGPPGGVAGPHDYLTEIHLEAQGFIRTLADRVTQGAAFFLDYGFPESEYYHPQRSGGTVMCHRAHLADPDPLSDVGEKDITAHVDFSGIALAAQDAGWHVLGYTSQAHFLMNCGLPQLLADAGHAQRAMGLRLIAEHEMGELFKVIALAKGEPWEPVGFANGDRSHTL